MCRNSPLSLSLYCDSLTLSHFCCGVFTNLIKGENVSALTLSTHTGNEQTDTELDYSTSSSMALKLQVL